MTKFDDKDITKGVIYSVKCRVNGKIYIGQALDFVGKSRKPHGASGRWSRHVSKAFNSPLTHFSEDTIWYAIQKFGRDAFDVTTLENCHISQLDQKEAEYIEKYDTIIPNGYNILSAKPRIFPEKLISLNIRQTLSRAHKKTDTDLPMYVVYVKAVPEKHSSEGYAIINHPKCRAKYFTSKSLSLEEKKVLALNHYNQLNMD